jgi:hypothetical protein
MFNIVWFRLICKVFFFKCISGCNSIGGPCVQHSFSLRQINMDLFGLTGKRDDQARTWDPVEAMAGLGCFGKKILSKA